MIFFVKNTEKIGYEPERDMWFSNYPYANDHIFAPIQWFKIRRKCKRLGHDFKFDSHGVIGDWIRCDRCEKLDEYIPGTHEPKGYVPKERKLFEVEG